MGLDGLLTEPLWTGSLEREEKRQVQKRLFFMFWLYLSHFLIFEALDSRSGPVWTILYYGVR